MKLISLPGENLDSVNLYVCILKAVYDINDKDGRWQAEVMRTRKRKSGLLT